MLERPARVKENPAAPRLFIAPVGGPSRWAASAAPEISAACETRA